MLAYSSVLGRDKYKEGLKKSHAILTVHTPKGLLGTPAQFLINAII